MNTYQLKLDMNKGPTYSVGMAYSGITLRQGDKRGCTVVAELYDHGTRFTEAGYTAYFVMGLPDREHYYREAATYSAGTATIIIDESLAASVAGDTVAYFELTKGGATYSTQGIKVSVLKDARADKTPGETYDSRIEQAIQELETAIAQAETQIEADVAEWLDQHPEATTTVQDNSITYAKLHSSTKQRLNNKLHRAIAAPVVTASDAYAAPPVAFVVDGKSVQDGTPAPDAPVAIQSVESVGLAAAGRNLAAGVVSGLYDGNTGRPFATSDYVRTEKIAALPSTGYVVSLTKGATGSHVYTYEWAADGSFVKRADRGGSTTTTPAIALTTDARTGFVAVACGGASANRETPDTISQLQLEQGSAATPYVPYVGSTTAIPLQGHALRSLPDGTHDELRVDADGNVTLVQRVGSYTVTGSETPTSSAQYGDYRRIVVTNCMAEGMGSRQPAWGSTTKGLCSHAPFVYDQTGESTHAYVAGRTLALFYPTTVSADVVAVFAGATLIYPLATPVEIPLGTVSLPSMPAPDLTAWASCTPATEIELDYERSVTIAVERLEAQIAEIATA